AEVSGQMQQVERTDGSRDFNKINLTLSGMQDRDLTNCIALEVQPKVGLTRVALLRTSVHEPLPSSRVIFLPHSVQRFRIVGRGTVKTEFVHGYAVHTGDHPAQVFIVLIEL